MSGHQVSVVPSIICHIGLHKTASGTLQRQFFPACEDLNLLTTLNPRIRDFINEVVTKDPIYFRSDKAREFLDGELSDRRVNLITNETLSGPPYAGVVDWGLDHRTPVLRNLKCVVPSADIVLVLRRQDGLAKSLYRQYVKRGGTVGIRRFFGLDGSKRPPLMSLDRFHFSPFVRFIRETFQSRFLVLTFEEFVRDQDAFIDRLCVFMGIARPKIALRRENATRLGYKGMEMTRLMNFGLRGMLNHGIVPGVPVRRNGQWRQTSVVEFIHDYWPGRPGNDLDSPLGKTGEEIWSMFKDDNRELDQEFELGLARFNYY